MPYLLVPRDPIADIKDTLSSWDKCMAKAYCKWPVIAAIIIGSLIVLSVVLCVARCICCGAECACCCFRCCAGCCSPKGSRGSSGHKRMDSEPHPPPVYPSSYPPAPMDTRPVHQQYRSHAAPTFNPTPAPEPERPQYATFDSPSKPVNEDALPAMPMMKDARSRYVEEEAIPEKRGDMEMDRLDRNGSMTSSNVASNVTGAAAVGRTSPGRSPVEQPNTQDSYGFPPGYQNNSFAGGAPPPRRSPHNSPAPYNDPYAQQQDAYRDVSPPVNASPVYGTGAGYAQNQRYERGPPNQAFDQYGQPAPRPSPSPPSANGYGYGAPPAPNNGFNFNDGYNDSFDSYVSAPPGSHTPGHNDGYNAGALPRTNTPGYNNNDYSSPAPPRSNTPGYNNGYSSPAPPPRSHTPGSTATAPPRYQSPAPAYPGQQTYETPETSYPGQQTYQAFKPAEPQGQQFSGVQR